METFLAFLAICAGNSPVPGELLAQRPVTRTFDVFFDLRPDKRLSKQSWGWWYETPSHPLWRHCNAWYWICKKNRFSSFTRRRRNDTKFQYMHRCYKINEFKSSTNCPNICMIKGHDQYISSSWLKMITLDRTTYRNLPMTPIRYHRTFLWTGRVACCFIMWSSHYLCYGDVTKNANAFQIIGDSTVSSTACLGKQQGKYQSFTSLTLRGESTSHEKGPIICKSSSSYVMSSCRHRVMKYQHLLYFKS